MEHVLDHTKSSPDFMDTTNPPYFDQASLSALDYLQYPNDTFDMSSEFGAFSRSSIDLLTSGRTVPGSSSPRIGGFNALNLTNGGMSSYTYGPTSSTFAGSTPARPFTPTSAGIYPGALSNLSAGDLSSDSGVGSSRSRRGSGSHSPGPAVPPGSLAAIPRSHRYNPLGTAAITRASARQAQQKKRAKASDEFASDDDEDFNPTTSLASNDMRREEIRRQRCTAMVAADFGTSRTMSLPPGPDADARDASMRQTLNDMDEGTLKAQFEEFAEIFCYDAGDAAEEWWINWGRFHESARGQQGMMDLGFNTESRVSVSCA